MLTFVESPLFTKLLGRYLSDDEYAELQGYLTAHPEAGAVIRGSGGVRKLRWAATGRGKRGGVRVIYYLKLERDQLWFAHALRQEHPGVHTGPCAEAD